MFSRRPHIPPLKRFILGVSRMHDFISLSFRSFKFAAFPPFRCFSLDFPSSGRVDPSPLYAIYSQKYSKTIVKTSFINQVQNIHRLYKTFIDIVLLMCYSLFVLESGVRGPPASGSSLNPDAVPQKARPGHARPGTPRERGDRRQGLASHPRTLKNE